jgi:hypothetical protein
MGSVTAEERTRVSAATSFALLANFNDQVFGTRPEGGFQTMTPIYDTDWRSNEALAESASKTIEATGRRVRVVQASEISMPEKATRSSPEGEMLAALSDAMTNSHPGLDVDIHLVVLPVALDRYGRPYRPGSYAMTWGILGLLSHEMEEFRPTYVARQNDVLTAIDWGKAECLAAYSLVAIDAKSHRIVARIDNRTAHTALPDDFWIADYTSLSDQNKNMLKRTCVEGMVSSVRQDLQALGIGAQTPRT